MEPSQKMQNLNRKKISSAIFHEPVLFHFGIEFLDSVDFIDRPKAFVAHEPVGFLLGQPAELVEGGLHKYLSKPQLFSFY